MTISKIGNEKNKEVLQLLSDILGNNLQAEFYHNKYLTKNTTYLRIYKSDKETGIFLSLPGSLKQHTPFKLEDFLKFEIQYTKSIYKNCCDDLDETHKENLEYIQNKIKKYLFKEKLESKLQTKGTTDKKVKI